MFTFCKIQEDNTLDKSDNYVIKIFKNKEYFDRENQLAEDILKRTGEQINQFICKVLTHTNSASTDPNSAARYSIVYTPCGKLIPRLTKDYVQKMLSCVEALHHYNIIHRDLSPHHFLINDKGNVSFDEF